MEDDGRYPANPLTVDRSLSLSSALNPCPYVRETRAMVAHLQPDVAKYAISGFIRVSQALGSKEISQTRVLALQT